MLRFILNVMGNPHEVSTKLASFPSSMGVHKPPFCCLQPWQMGSEFVTKCKTGVFQYVIVRFVNSTIMAVLSSFGLYEEGVLTIASPFIWITAVNVCSQGWALYSLFLFFVCVHKELQGIRPFSKFLCIKLVLFLSFWQSQMIGILVRSGLINSGLEHSAQEASVLLRASIVSFEMLVAAIGFAYAFPVTDFAPSCPTILTSYVHFNYESTSASAPTSALLSVTSNSPSPTFTQANSAAIDDADSITSCCLTGLLRSQQFQFPDRYYSDDPESGQQQQQQCPGQIPKSSAAAQCQFLSSSLLCCFRLAVDFKDWVLYWTPGLAQFVNAIPSPAAVLSALVIDFPHFSSHGFGPLLPIFWTSSTGATERRRSSSSNNSRASNGSGQTRQGLSSVPYPRPPKSPAAHVSRSSASRSHLGSIHHDLDSVLINERAVKGSGSGRGISPSHSSSTAGKSRKGGTGSGYNSGGSCGQGSPGRSRSRSQSSQHRSARAFAMIQKVPTLMGTPSPQCCTSHSNYTLTNNSSSSSTSCIGSGGGGGHSVYLPVKVSTVGIAAGKDTDYLTYREFDSMSECSDLSIDSSSHHSYTSNNNSNNSISTSFLHYHSSQPYAVPLALQHAPNPWTTSEAGDILRQPEYVSSGTSVHSKGSIHGGGSVHGGGNRSVYQYGYRSGATPVSPPQPPRNSDDTPSGINAHPVALSGSSAVISRCSPSSLPQSMQVGSFFSSCAPTPISCISEGVEAGEDVIGDWGSSRVGSCTMRCRSPTKLSSTTAGINSIAHTSAASAAVDATLLSSGDTSRHRNYAEHRSSTVGAGAAVMAAAAAAAGVAVGETWPTEHSAVPVTLPPSSSHPSADTSALNRTLLRDFDCTASSVPATRAGAGVEGTLCSGYDDDSHWEPNKRVAEKDGAHQTPAWSRALWMSSVPADDLVEDFGDLESQIAELCNSVTIASPIAQLKRFIKGKMSVYE